uniref:Curlin n=1 Tax=Cereibacter sphaeroides (strain ATCC 17025 / ATH 2.4.3) TaxID=349102 RepID=A4WYK5_CERS5
MLRFMMMTSALILTPALLAAQEMPSGDRSWGDRSWGNRASTTQIGSNNSSTISQSGKGNVAISVQSGDGHVRSITQQGNFQGFAGLQVSSRFERAAGTESRTGGNARSSVTVEFDTVPK